MPSTHDNIFIYADSGVGKTVFSCSSQKRRTLLFNIEDGWKSAKTWQGSPDGVFPPINHNLVHVTERIDSSDKFLAAYNYLLQNVRNYDLVVLDTATELQKVLIRDIINKRKKLIPEQQDWGMALSQMEFFFTQMRMLPLTKIVLAHEQLKYNPNTGYNEYGPSFQGAIRTDFARHFDEIWRLMLQQVQLKDEQNNVHNVTQRWMKIHPDQNSKGKTRANSLAPFEVPVLDNILFKIQGV